MDADVVDKLLASIRSGNVDHATAARALDQEAVEADVPVLEGLLRDPDDEVREAVAVPYARLVGPRSLETLVRVFQQGLDEGSDGENLQETIAQLIKSDESKSHRILDALAAGQDAELRQNAAWLLERSQSELLESPFARAAVLEFVSLTTSKGDLNIVLRALPNRLHKVLFSNPQAYRHVHGYLHRPVCKDGSWVVRMRNSRWLLSLTDEAHMHPHPHPEYTAHYQILVLGHTIDVLSNKSPEFEEIERESDEIDT